MMLAFITSSAQSTLALSMSRLQDHFLRKNSLTTQTQPASHAGWSLFSYIHSFSHYSHSSFLQNEIFKNIFTLKVENDPKNAH